MKLIDKLIGSLIGKVLGICDHHDDCIELKQCMCCGKMVAKLNEYESPSPRAKHYEEWCGIKKIRICHQCANTWSNLMNDEKDQDLGITKGNKWLFRRIIDTRVVYQGVTI